MHQSSHYKPHNSMTHAYQVPISTVAERLLAATAIRVELPPSSHRLAVQRKAAVERHLERDSSQLKDRIRWFYQQGSMAIGATIKAWYRDEGFDIDIVVETLFERDMKPDQILDLLYAAVRGDRGSRYYDCTERQTRCVTIYYKDGMHLDLTPSVLLDEGDPRLSYIFHSKPESPRSSDQRILTNSHAFAVEYNTRCPIDISFAAEYARRARKADTTCPNTMLDAESEPVPEHSLEAGGKSSLTVALQLQKRHRNIQYQNRDARMPPSVMLSCIALEVAEPGRTIGENLRAITTHLLHRLSEAAAKGHLIQVLNPRCSNDCFTDRWPENHAAQDLYIRDLERLLEQLDRFLNDNCSLKDRSQMLEAMFGEGPARSALGELANEYGPAIRSGDHFSAGNGSVVLGPAAIQASRPKAPENTFHGGVWPRK